MEKVLAAQCLIAGLLIGCSNQPGDETNSLIDRTIVTQNSDGTSSVRKVQLTREQQARDLAALFRAHGETDLAKMMDARADELSARTGDPTIGVAQQATATKDPDCGLYSVHVFSQAGYTGNELCAAGLPTDQFDLVANGWNFGWGVHSVVNFESSYPVETVFDFPFYGIYQVCREVYSGYPWDGTGAGNCDSSADLLTWPLQ